MTNTTDRRAVPIDAKKIIVNVKLVKNMHMNTIMNIQYVNTQQVVFVRNATIVIIHCANILINHPTIMNDPTTTTIEMINATTFKTL